MVLDRNDYSFFLVQEYAPANYEASTYRTIAYIASNKKAVKHKVFGKYF